MNRKWFNAFVILGMLLMQFAAVTPASAQPSEGEGPPEGMHCPTDGTKFDFGSGSETLDGATVSWDGSTVEVEDGSAVICVKAADQNSGVIVVTDTWSVNWLNPGGQIPDISYLVVYKVKPDKPEPTETPTATPTATPTDTPEPTETPFVCQTENFVLTVEVVNLSDTRAQLQASATWDNGPSQAFINWEFGGRIDTYNKGDTLTWDVDRRDSDYELAVSAYVLEGEETCATDSETVTVEAQPSKPTPSPTPTATPTDTPEPTPTESPTPEPSPTEPPEECVKADSAVFDGNRATFNREGGEDCINVFAVYNTHGFANLQEPGAFQTLIGYAAGTAQTLEVPEYNPEEGCFVQLDAMVVSSMDEVPAVVPETLTNENQGPQFAALVAAVTRGNRVCEFEEPEGEEIVTCPECGDPVWEEIPEGQAGSYQYSVGPCVVCKGGLKVDTWVRFVGHEQDFKIYYRGETYTPEKHTGADGQTWYDLTIDLVGYDHNWIWLAPDAPDITSLIGFEDTWRLDRELLQDNEFVVCSMAPSYADTDANGVAHWHDGHQTSDWAKFLMSNGEVDSYEEGLEWAEQLREAGSLELPST